MPPPSGSTPTLLLPYPVPNDPVDVPRDIKALADKLDSSLGGGGSGGGGVLKAAPVLDVGVTGQVRAGRQLALADFTDLGLSAPAGLWNLSNLTDASGNGRTLSNKGAVPFAAGINGTAATAAQFSGSTAQALYIADTGAADPFRIRTGSWGRWFRTAKRGTQQVTLSKTGVSGAYTWSLNITNVNTASGWTSADGVNIVSATGVSDVTDDRWHFAVMTHDATAIRMYVDGVLEAVAAAAYTIGGGSGVVNIGAAGADGATAATNANYGRVDEAFVTADVLTEDQIRVLYAARIAHTLGTTPRSATLTVNRAAKAQRSRSRTSRRSPCGSTTWPTAAAPTKDRTVRRSQRLLAARRQSLRVPMAVPPGPSMSPVPMATRRRIRGYRPRSPHAPTDAGSKPCKRPRHKPSSRGAPSTPATRASASRQEEQCSPHRAPTTSA
jgi:hypothetical protein